MVDDRRLQQLLLSRVTPERLVDALITEANGRGGLDNITAIIVQVTSMDDDQLDTTTAETPAFTPES
jgi:protein phosphatase